LNAFQGFGDFIVEHVLSAASILSAMVERLLHEPDVAGVAQKLSAAVMAKIMEAKTGDPCPLAYQPPGRGCPGIGDRIALASDEAMPVAPDGLIEGPFAPRK
jgi:hypothetical protein